MGLIHVLKWSHIQFDNKEELEQLPRDLLDDWAMTCLEYIRHPRIKKLKPGTDHWFLMRNARLWFIMDQPRNLQTSDIFEEIVTRQFNSILQKKIREYED
jgi:hypothetical protein